MTQRSLLIFDTETTGLLKSRPHLVQLAYVIYTEDPITHVLVEASSVNHYIKLPESIPIPPEAPTQPIVPLSPAAPAPAPPPPA